MNASRLPVSTYEQAVWRLAQVSVQTPSLSAEVATVCLRLVADIFWVPEAKVSSDLRKACKAVS